MIVEFLFNVATCVRSRLSHNGWLTGRADLAGRIDNDALEAAVARASEVVPYKDAIRSHLNQILASDAFRGSHRSQEFLSHVVEHALSGDFSGIKERILGIRIFGREASSYDTSYDSIVRVTASDVRKRLLRYYKTSATSVVRIGLPSGSYIPEFHYGEAADSPLTAADANPLPYRRGISGDHVGVTATPADESVVAVEGNGGAWRPSDGASHSSHTAHVRLRFIWATGLLCLVLLAAVWSIAAFHAKADRHRDSYISAQYRFYRELLGPIATDLHQETKIVLSNPLVFLYRGSDLPPPTSEADGGKKKVQIPQQLARNLTSGAGDTQGGFHYPYLALDTTNYTGLGEAQTAFNLRKLFDILSRSTELTEMRFLNWNEARNQHLVLLGGRPVGQWTQSDAITANFTMEHDVIRNAHPKPKEQPFYVPRFEGRVLEDYGLIWMSQSPSGSRMLVLAGLTSTGTAGVGDFFTDPNQMRPVFEKLKAASPNGSIPANWQVLLRITARDEVPLNVSFVGLRVSSATQ